METKAFATKIISTEGDDERTVVGLSAVIGVVDSGNDLIHKGAFKKTIKDRAERVKHLWQHDNSQPPIATVLELKEIGVDDLPTDMRSEYPGALGGLLVKRRYLDTPRGSEVLAGLRSTPPAINEMSFGYDPVKWDFEENKDSGILVRNLRELRLWDTSDVNWGMNSATMAEMKSAIPYKDTGKAPEDAEWSAPSLSDFTDEAWEDLSDGEKRRVAAHYAWSAEVPPETFGSLKLPHHKPAKSGVGPAVWRGVAAAMGALMGARGGVDIPSGDKSACHAHLAKHYEQFDKEPPEMKALQLIWAIDEGLSTYEGDGRILPRLVELSELLRAEPPNEALTLLVQQEKLLRRLQVARREVSLLR